jgi:hypothetical protein
MQWNRKKIEKEKIGLLKKGFGLYDFGIVMFLRILKEL